MPVSHSLGRYDRAERILTGCFLSAEPVSRRNALIDLGGAGDANLGARREWAVAWQDLQRAGFICPEPGYPADGDVWFITSAGVQARNGPTSDYLARDLPG